MFTLAASHYTLIKKSQEQNRVSSETGKSFRENFAFYFNSVCKKNAKFFVKIFVEKICGQKQKMRNFPKQINAKFLEKKNS